MDISCISFHCKLILHFYFYFTGFDELACRCGSTVLYPPVACGAKPPECDKPCNRAHSCGHQRMILCNIYAFI